MRIEVQKLKRPRISDRVQAAIEVASSRDPDIRELCDLVSADPVLSAHVVRYANAPLYRRRVEVTNVRNAVNLLGVKNVRLALYVVVLRAARVRSGMAHTLLWEHTSRIATLSRLIARHVASPLADDIELTALMHDIGAIVLADNFTEEYDHLMEGHFQGESLHRLEEVRFGCGHDVLLGELADELRLPGVTRRALERFHSRDPLFSRTEEWQTHAMVVALAHHLEQQVMEMVSRKVVEEIPEGVETLQTALGLSDDEMAGIVERFEELLETEEMV